ncbi:DNase I-like protein [Annulohypoxylon nitens]|nr:DNase I-like protein [Annulohypoxylon nitens]
MAGVDCLPEEINVLSLNVWGIPYISQDRTTRIEEIGRQIVKANPQPHIVGLQECFSRGDFDRIHQETRSILPYSKQYFAGPLGTGLVLLSRWPIEETSVTRYPLNGSPTALFHGDWYAGKGVAYARVRYGKGPDDVINVFNTHLHAYYSGNEYLCHRVSQAWELAKILRAASRKCHGKALTILLGDLNAEPTSLPYRILEHFVPDMHDTWLQDSLRRTQGVRADQEAWWTDADVQSGVTYGSPRNTWMWTRAQRARYREEEGNSTGEVNFPEVGREEAVRIDYVFASVQPDTKNDPATDKVGERKGNNSSIIQDVDGWTVKSAKVGMMDRHPVLGCSLSDHLSVEVTLAFKKTKQVEESMRNRESVDEPTNSGSGVLARSKEGSKSKTHVHELEETMAADELLRKPDIVKLLDEILHVLEDSGEIQKRSAWWRKVRLSIACIVLAGSLAGVWVVGEPGWARLLLALAGASASTIAALDIWANISLISAETAALGEFEWEIRNIKRGLSEG